MTTIRMELETIRSTARQFKTQASEIQSSADTLKRAASALSGGWEGSGAEDFNQGLRNLAKQMASQGDELETLSMRMNREADDWEETDSSLAEEKRDGGGGGWWGSIKRGFSKTTDALEFGAKAIVVGGIVAGASYAGQAIFYGGRTIKDLAGISGLTHIRISNLPRFMFKGDPFEKGLSGKLAVIGAGLEFAERGINDFYGYAKGSEKAAAILLDGAFVVGKTYAKHYAGYMAASGATAALLLAVPAAPVAAVGAVGLGAWFVGSQVTGWVADKGFDAVKEPLVKGTAQVFEKTGDALQSAGGAIKSGGGKVVDAVFVNPAKKFKSLFG